MGHPHRGRSCNGLGVLGAREVAAHPPTQRREAAVHGRASMNVMKRGLAGGNVGSSKQPASGGPGDVVRRFGLSRKRLDVLLDEERRTVEVTAVRPDADALRTLVSHVQRHGHEVTAAIESMTGARFVHDQLELRGWVSPSLTRPRSRASPRSRRRPTGSMPGSWPSCQSRP